MKSHKIVATGPIDEIAADILSPFGEIVIAADYSEETLLPLLEDAIGLVVRGEGVANARVIEAARDLKVIGRSGAGYNNVDIAAVTSRKIPVVYTPGANARAVAEAAITFMLTLCKKVFYWDQQLKSGNWQSRFQSKPQDLGGGTLGIIGFGSIGQMLAELICPFNMQVLAYDPYVLPGRTEELHVNLVGLNELLRQSNFICIHAALTDKTHDLINRERLSLVKPGSYLINLARGGLIESLDVLYEAMMNGTLAGVGLDVFEPEPPDVTHPIFKLPNCLTAPHALGMTPGAMAKIFKSMAEDMVAVLRGSRPRFVVNPEVIE